MTTTCHTSTTDNDTSSIGHTSVHVEITRTRIADCSLRLVGLLEIPESIDVNSIDDIKLLATTETATGTSVLHIPLDLSAGKRLGQTNNAGLYSFRYRIGLNEPSFTCFTASIDDVTTKIEITCRPFNSNFSEALGNVIRHKRMTIKLDCASGCLAVSRLPFRDSIWTYNPTRTNQGLETRALRLIITRLLDVKDKSHKQIWLYLDSNGKTDNAWLQFLHDAYLTDGVIRYYVAHGVNVEMPSSADSKHARVITFGSKTHKLIHYLADKRLCADISREVTSPWADEETWAWYCDLDNAEQVYLQHGVLWAHMPEYYSYEVTGMDREVVSTHFEIDNLVHNYGFKPDDLITSGMPRYDTIPLDSEPQRKILLCPSWRGYLAGAITTHGREPLDAAFIESSFYINLVKFLTSSELEHLLHEYDYSLDLKLHPNFACYRRHFTSLDAPFTLIDEVIEHEYAVAITDYSSYSFDFVYLKRALVYFIPDEREFYSGYNHYNKFDIPLDQAFGDLVHSPEAAIDAIKHILENAGKPLPQHADRQYGLFLHYDNSQRTRLYEAISN